MRWFNLDSVWLTQYTYFYLLLQGHLPFAVVGSTEEVCVGNKMVKARQYPWGVVQGGFVLMQLSQYYCSSVNTDDKLTLMSSYFKY